MKLLVKELVNRLDPRDFKPGNHIYLKGYHCNDLDFIVGCYGINNKAISVFRPNNPCRKIEYIDLYKTCLLDLHIGLCVYEDSEFTRPSEYVEVIDEISIERNPTEYHHDFCLRELLETPPWSWAESCDVSKLKNGDKLVIHYFTVENELKIRTLEMEDFFSDSRHRWATMYNQFLYVSNVVKEVKELKIARTNVIVPCDSCDDVELARTGCFDFKLGNSVLLTAVDTFCRSSTFQFSLICGLQLIKADNRTK